ncbi:hypothetical protein, partial [Komagataeibacter rhaeticus]|uniref:hypothetical protein n=1 Tax=Komagataeibacter rhaeticus TaxID=215221 RepID=UPI001CD32C8B
PGRQSSPPKEQQPRRQHIPSRYSLYSLVKDQSPIGPNNLANLTSNLKKFPSAPPVSADIGPTLKTVNQKMHIIGKKFHAP